MIRQITLEKGSKSDHKQVQIKNSIYKKKRK